MKIFLIGFMGSGKTHWGKVWAEKNNLSFYDLDVQIEKECNMSITEIFDKKGEEKFREMESTHLRKFGGKENFLLSCGGGTPCFSNNMNWMKAEGKIVYLKASPEQVLKRITSEIEQRPVIKNVKPSERLSFIQKKLAEREPFYSQADHIFNAETLDENSLSSLLSTAK